jgi:hypothetical protein
MNLNTPGNAGKTPDAASWISYYEVMHFASK